jgi:multisubunit Na+/H+ antiporter MnhB subunit
VLIEAKPIGHFPAMLIFALMASLALACVTHRTVTEQIKYAAWSFFLFVAVAVGIAWAMYPLSR